MSAPIRRQFSIRHLLLLMLLVSVALALATQFKHIGIAVAFYVIGAAAGWWFGSWRLTVASLTALLIFVSAYVACWIQLAHAMPMDGGSYGGDCGRTLFEMQAVRDGILAYEREQGHPPDALGDLAPKYYVGYLPLDGWQHPFVYRALPAPQRFELVSLGRDGEPGGRGLDADAQLTATSEIDNNPWITERLPLIQFLFEARGSRLVFTTILVASFLAGSLWFISAQIPIQSRQWLVTSLLATVIASVVVAVFLAMLHVTAQGSGH